MNHRERIMAVLRGQATDRIPWNIYAWILPHTPAAERLRRKGLTLMGTRSLYRTVYGSDIVIREDQRDVAGVTHIHKTIETPKGTLTEESTIETGYGSRWIKKYLITDPEDYAAAEYLARCTTFEPDYEPWLQADAEMGNAGYVIGEIMPIPVMTLMVNWLGVEGLAQGVYLYPERFESLLAALDVHYDRQVALAADGPAEVIWWGDNVTGSIISPKLFARYVAPVYERALPILQQVNKFPIAHYDGSNRPLKKALAQTGLPIIEAFTPPPGGDLPVSEAKAAWPDKVIGLNFPASFFLESFETIYNYTLNLLADAAPGGRMYLGCTEDFPPEHFEKTFSAMGQALAEYEGLEWEGIDEKE
jgi:hypothetical protein